jgi:type I restriction enzyme S subunit
VDKEKADPEYIYWYLQYLHQTGEMWKHQVQHTGVARFQYTRFADTHKIPLPPLSEQRAVSVVLAAFDDKIAINDRIATTTRKLAESQFQASIQAVDSLIYEVGEIADFLSRGVTPRYTDDLAQLMVLNQKCVRNGRIQFDAARRTMNDRVPAQKLLQDGDVLVNSTGFGTLGRVARWTHEQQCTVDSHVAIVRFNQAKVDPVCAGFAMLAAQPEIETLGEGSTGQTELSRARLGAVRLTMPNKKLAAGLQPKLNALEGSGDAALQESIALAELRDTLLPKLMSGEIRVREAEEMVAEVT